MIGVVVWAVQQAAEGETSGFSKWIGAAIILGSAIVLATAARWALRRIGRIDGRAGSAPQILARLVFALIVAVGLYVALQAVGLDLGPVLAGAGIVGIAIAFALQDIAENYMSGLIMGFRNPFSPGDEIVSGDHEGSVEELNLRYTTIRTYDGARVLLPNSMVLTNPLTNLTANGRRRSDFSLGVAYGTDLEQARTVAIAAVGAVEEVYDDPPPQAWVEELDASWISIRVRFWHGPRIADMWRVRSAAIVAAVAGMQRAGIDLPFERRIIDLVVPDPVKSGAPDAAEG